MLVKIIALLTIIQLIGTQGTINSSDSIDNGSSINDNSLRDISEQLEILQQKIDLVSLSIQQQLTKQKHDFESSFNKLSTLAKVKQPFRTDVFNGHNFEHEAQSIEFGLLPTNCAEALKKSGRKDGVHKIKLLSPKSESFYVYCFTHNANQSGIDDSIRANATNPWTIMQRRSGDSVDFKRNWVEYQQGFGNLEGDFFLGLDIINYLTQSTLHELWIQVEDFRGRTRWAKYSTFAIAGESEDYPIKILGSYTGNAGDSLSDNVDQKFTTIDRDNDKSAELNCALFYLGAWWHKDCTTSNLYRKFYGGKDPNKMMNANSTTDTVKYAHMAIRPII